MTESADPSADPSDDPSDGADRLAEETGRLFDAVQEWARRTLPAPPGGHPGPDCEWCPLCRLASVLRGEHPELTERAAETGAILLATLKTFLETAAAHAPTPSPRAGRRRPRPGPAPHEQDVPEADES